MITITQRKKIIETIDSIIWEIYTSIPLAKKIKTFCIEYNIPNKDTLIDTIGDTILGFHKTSELTELLQKEVGVSADDAQRINADLKEFLAPVIAREKGEVNPNHKELKELQEVFTPTPESVESQKPQGNKGSPQNSVVDEKEHSTVQPMRTMEGDITRIHGYGAYRAQFPDEPQEAEHKEEIIRSASQEDILQEKPKLAEMPTYENEEEK